ncbi:urea carboxylase-associated family protein [Bradyrhizobium prioriisuperbiae]|uniref:urea carboxylase-associated family protein n=1 Tax=Bradyrhizobium prioriisuperbiae TaxID=2854389 RepID=UPI0028E21BA7|nr:urea carboxylase-associated family protein [Bradyrhizobium prioritasuperba]
MSEVSETIPATRGKAIRLGRGQAVKVINTHGSQVVDTWAFCIEDLRHHMSMEHTRVENARLMPAAGQTLFTNKREPILVLEEDTSPGIHDTLMAACDRWRYKHLGCTDYHRNCADNMIEAMAEIGLSAGHVPQPLNLFMNIPVNSDLSLTQGEPVSRPGDHVLLRATRDCYVVFSACPQDITPINGAERKPTEAHIQLMG